MCFAQSISYPPPSVPAKDVTAIALVPIGYSSLLMATCDSVRVFTIRLMMVVGATKVALRRPRSQVSPSSSRPITGRSP